MGSYDGLKHPDYCAEFQYMTSEGNVHSDICSDKSDEYRQFLHDCLDEFLNNTNTSDTGFFRIGTPN